MSQIWIKGGSYKINLIWWRRRRKFWWFFIDFSIENVICECKNVKIFACGALECGRSSKNLIKPLILVKIGVEGAEKNWGFWEFIRTPPLIEYRSELRGGVLINNRSDLIWIIKENSLNIASVGSQTPQFRRQTQRSQNSDNEFCGIKYPSRMCFAFRCRHLPVSQTSTQIQRIISQTVGYYRQQSVTIPEQRQ